MNFTREPIIETIITPREGFKLVVRSSKAGGQEEYVVDAVEVVSFGHSFFFRSLERPKSFIVPVSDYEVVETKETRVVLKSLSVEKAIKIGGGREATIKAPKEPSADRTSEKAQPAAPGEPRIDKKRERHRRRRRRPGDEAKPASEEQAPLSTEEQAAPPSPPQGGDVSDETKVSAPVLSRLFPPPPSLISETLGRDKRKDEGAPQGDNPPEKIAAPEEKQAEEPWGGETKDMMRQNSEALVTSTSFFGRLFS